MDENEDIYITVELAEYLRLLDLRDFLQDLFDADLENWEGFEEVVTAFLEDEDRTDPRDEV